MNRPITAFFSAAMLVAPAFGADSPTKPQGGQTGVMMERSAGEEMKGMAGNKGVSPAKDMKGLSPAKDVKTVAPPSSVAGKGTQAGVAKGKDATDKGSKLGMERSLGEERPAPR